MKDIFEVTKKQMQQYFEGEYLKIEQEKEVEINEIKEKEKKFWNWFWDKTLN